MLPLIPDRRSALQALARGYAVPIAQPIPVSLVGEARSCMARLATEQPRWLLESSRTHRVSGRYSYLGWQPTAVLVNAPLHTIRARLSRYPMWPVPALPPFVGGAIGYLGYECRHAFEQLPQRACRDRTMPESVFALYDTIVAWDHLREMVYVITRAIPEGSPARQYDEAAGRLEAIAEQLALNHAADDRAPTASCVQLAVGASPREPAPVDATVDPDRFAWMVRCALDYIKAGDIYQANLSIRWTTQTSESPWAIYDRLQRINPSPYAAYGECDAWTIVSSSPELLLRVRGHEVATRPIAGTRPRGATPHDDLAQAIELILSDKERAEHLMLVDLERNDLGRVCRYGSVAVDELMTLEDYSHVMHIVSNVRGRLQPARDWADAVAALFPGGTITGCPKIRAMEIIDELEPTARGIYTGSLGWISWTGDADFNIAIRTMILHDGVADLQAGAGIVADSQPAREYAECLAKARALLEAVQPAQPAPVFADALHEAA